VFGGVLLESFLYTYKKEKTVVVALVEMWIRLLAMRKRFFEFVTLLAIPSFLKNLTKRREEDYG